MYENVMIGSEINAVYYVAVIFPKKTVALPKESFKHAIDENICINSVPKIPGPSLLNLNILCACLTRSFVILCMFLSFIYLFTFFELGGGGGVFYFCLQVGGVGGGGIILVSTGHRGRVGTEKYIASFLLRAIRLVVFLDFILFVSRPYVLRVQPSSTLPPLRIF